MAEIGKRTAFAVRSQAYRPQRSPQGGLHWWVPLVGRQRSRRRAQLLMHHVTQHGVVHGAAEIMTVHEEARCSGDAELFALGIVLLPRPRLLAGVEALIERRAIQLEGLCLILQLRDFELLVGEQSIV